jgi:hypothetical protein
MWARQGSNLQLDRCELSADLKHRLGSFTAVGPAPSLTAAGWLLEFSTTIVNRGFDSHSLRQPRDFVRQPTILNYFVRDRALLRMSGTCHLGRISPTPFLGGLHHLHVRV